MSPTVVNAGRASTATLVAVQGTTQPTVTTVLTSVSSAALVAQVSMLFIRDLKEQKILGWEREDDGARTDE